MRIRRLVSTLTLLGWTALTGCAAPPPQKPDANSKKEKQAVTEHFLNSLRTHDITLPGRAADIPGDWLEQVAKGWKELDAESRDIAVSTATKMRGRPAGKFLLSVAALTGEEASTPAAAALITHPDCPDGNTLLAAAQPIKDPLTRAHLYRAAGAHGAAVSVFEPIAAKETNAQARQAALEGMARLGHLPSLRTLYERVVKATAAEVLVLHDALVYVGDKRLAKALVSWLHKTDPISRMGSDRSPAMVRQCDYALWTAHLLAIGVTMPVNRIDNYAPGILAAAKPVLLALPDLPAE
ncbi:MAG: hypothetical protein ACKV2U_08180 [Bryobacteraceae bacterium]